MFRWIVGSSLKFRFLVLAAAGVLLFFGTEQLRKMPVDVFPEFAPPKVEIQTEGLGMTAAEVEELIAQWFQHWQGTLSDEEARRRAKLYMRALPAWNRNCHAPANRGFPARWISLRGQVQGFVDEVSNSAARSAALRLREVENHQIMLRHRPGDGSIQPAVPERREVTGGLIVRMDRPVHAIARARCFARKRARLKGSRHAAGR